MTFGNIFILGDSYSTYEGYLAPGCWPYYGTGDGLEKGLETVDNTWWKLVEKETDSKIVMNNSWSGTTVCNTGYGGYCPDSSFVNRVRRVLIDGVCLGEKIDTVFVFGGTNDFWNNSPVGELKYDGITEDETVAFLPAMSLTVKYLRETAPDARVVCIINSDLSPEITDGTVDICKHFGAEYVLLHDLEKSSGHPTITGMRQIADRIKEILK